MPTGAAPIYSNLFTPHQRYLHNENMCVFWAGFSFWQRKGKIQATGIFFTDETRRLCLSMPFIYKVWIKSISHLIFHSSPPFTINTMQDVCRSLKVCAWFLLQPAGSKELNQSMQHRQIYQGLCSKTWKFPLETREQFHCRAMEDTFLSRSKSYNTWGY